MKVNAFEITEPVPDLREPVAIAMLQPWVDVGSVGSVVLGDLRRQLGAKELARLSRPGAFFDFTRYRPEMRIVDGERVLIVPNTVAHHGRDVESGRDYILLDIREPHAIGEDYADAIAALLTHFGVSEYCRIGGMMDTVPHTRPLTVTATLDEEQVRRVKGLVSTRGSGYQGPTSIVNRVTELLAEAGVRTTSLMVHMPQYVQLDEDHMGAYRLIEVLCAVYGFPDSLADPTRGEQQYHEITQAAERNPQVKGLIQQLEADFDRGRTAEAEVGEEVSLTPEVEDFLREMGHRLESPRDDD